MAATCWRMCASASASRCGACWSTWRSLPNSPSITCRSLLIHVALPRPCSNIQLGGATRRASPTPVHGGRTGAALRGNAGPGRSRARMVSGAGSEQHEQCRLVAGRAVEGRDQRHGGGRDTQREQILRRIGARPPALAEMATEKPGRDRDLAEHEQHHRQRQGGARCPGASAMARSSGALAPSIANSSGRAPHRSSRRPTGSWAKAAAAKIAPRPRPPATRPARAAVRPAASAGRSWRR